MQLRSLLVCASGIAFTAPALTAQIAWETPRLLGPESPEGFGVHWLRAGTLPGDGNAVLVTWDLPGLPRAIGLRGGAGDGSDGSASVFGGLDVRTELTRHRPGQPVDVSWTVGVGLGVGDYGLLTVPVGISAGRSWTSGSVWLAPYAGVGIALDLRMGGAAPQDEFVVQPSADLGVDLALDRGRRLVLRAAASLGDRQAIAVGALVRTGR